MGNVLQADNQAIPGKKVVDRSCPKTPNLEACSEELVLKLSEEDDEKEEKHGKHYVYVLYMWYEFTPASSADGFKKSPFPAFSDKQADWTITDSFLDRAMDTHMSEEDCAEAESNKPREEKDGEQRDEHTALPPMPKPTAVTPRSERSKRLSRRRRLQAGASTAGCDIRKTS